MTVRILNGDCRDVLATLPDESVHCVVTSPPYWGLRDYGVVGQIGLEPSFADYIEAMRAVFAEVRRVLRKDGTLWLNLGDSYGAMQGSGFALNALNGKKSDKRTLETAAANQIQVNTGMRPKNLLGIPWRVAFALQAPQYLGRIHNETDRAWLAALTDGEGCITILRTTSPHGSGDSYPPVISVRMCDRQMIDKAMELVGCNGDSPAQYPASMEGQRPAYQWRIHGRKAADTIAEIYPFLLIKRKQAIIAWNHQQVRDSYHTKRGVKIPEDALEKQKLCCELIQKLNQKEQVDVPSWMIEPPAMFGPGWYLRSDVIWSKPNPMPELVTDRPTKAHEYLFLLSKSERYWYDAEAIREEIKPESGQRMRAPKYDGGRGDKVNNPYGDVTQKAYDEIKGANRRTVWEIATSPFPEAHFATFPPALVEPCILAGCPQKCCAKCGAPWVREIETVRTKDQTRHTGRAAIGCNDRQDGDMPRMLSTIKTLGFSPSCSCKTTWPEIWDGSHLGERAISNRSRHCP